ncbi:hypothetical protein KL942_005311 [Ogataea angusta]|uniref:Uncharacterized protein n=1 Tax=Pichia angusta TaxID=870730 RepID=A0ABQ7RPL8_PICAN|nr:hypothetical protein KL942_005311 [Ogataea angusta]KAG7845093.1 hypothetical protein KL940_005327 [Ogataea angusta]
MDYPAPHTSKIGTECIIALSQRLTIDCSYNLNWNSYSFNEPVLTTARVDSLENKLATEPEPAIKLSINVRIKGFEPAYEYNNQCHAWATDISFLH